MITLEKYIINSNIDSVFESLNDENITEGKIWNGIKKVWNWLFGDSDGKKWKDDEYIYYNKYNNRSFDDSFFDEIPKVGCKTSSDDIIKQVKFSDLKDIIKNNENLQNITAITDKLNSNSKLNVNILVSKNKENDKDNCLAIAVFSDDTNFVNKYKDITNTSDSVVLLAFEYLDGTSKTSLMELVLSISKGINKRTIIICSLLNNVKSLRYIFKKLKFKDVTLGSERIGKLNIEDLVDNDK